MKVGIIGAGFVGSTTAYTLVVKGLAQEIVLVDINEVKAEAEALDILHATALNSECNIKFGSYADLNNADIVIITVDCQKALTDSRLALLESNTKIMHQIVPEIAKNAPDSIILIATNPVDVITKVVLDISGFAPSKVIGSGTVLDTARFRTMLGQYFEISPQSVHAYVMGEHGASSLVSFSNAYIGGLNIDDYAAKMNKPLTAEFKKQMAADVIDAGFKIYRGKKATYYGIASSLVRICEAIIKNERKELTVSTVHEDVLGVKDVCLSLPVIVGRNGAVKAVVPELNEQEQQQLKKSAEIMKEAFNEAKKI